MDKKIKIDNKSEKKTSSEINKVEKRSNLPLDKEKKKRIITLSIIFSCVALMLAGIIVGLLFLFKTDPPAGEPNKFSEILINNNNDKSEITEQEIILPSDIEPSSIIYVDDKYIIVEVEDVQTIYMRTESTLIKLSEFDFNDGKVQYDKVNEIHRDYAYISDTEINKTYVVSLINNTALIETTDYEYVSFNNGFAVCYSNESTYLKVIVKELNLNIDALVINEQDGYLEIRVENNYLMVSNSSKIFTYNFELNNNKLRLINEKIGYAHEPVDDNYVAKENEVIVDYEGQKAVIRIQEKIILETQNYILYERLIPTDDYTLAMAEDLCMCKVEYKIMNLKTGAMYNINFGGRLTHDKDENLTDYYVCNLSTFSTFDENGIIKERSEFVKTIILDDDLNEIYSHTINDIEIVYSDGEKFVVSGLNGDIVDTKGNSLNIIDTSKFKIETQNVWNNNFVISGISGYGISDMQGNVVVSNVFSIISPILDGYAIGYYEGHYYRLDLKNNTGTLINDFDINYSAYAFMGAGFYVVEENDTYKIYNVSGELLYNNVKNIKLLSVDSKNLNILIDADKIINLNVTIVDKTIADSYINNECYLPEIDDSIECEDTLELNILNDVLSYAKEKEQENDDDKKKLETFDSDSSSIKYIDYDATTTSAYPDLNGKIITYKTDSSIGETSAYSIYQFSDFWYAGSSGTTLSDLRNNNFGLFKNTKAYRDGYYINDSILELMPEMNWSTGKLNSGQYGPVSDYYMYDKGSYNTGYEHYFEKTWIYKIGDIAIIAMTIIKHVYYEEKKTEVGEGCDKSYVYSSEPVSTTYSLYPAIVVADGVLVQNVKVIEGGNTIVDFANSSKNFNGYETVSEGAGIIGGSGTGFNNPQKVNSDGSVYTSNVTLNNSIVMRGIKFSRANEILISKDRSGLTYTESWLGSVYSSNQPGVEPKLLYEYASKPDAITGQWSPLYLYVDFGITASSLTYKMYDTGYTTIGEHAGAVGYYEANEGLNGDSRSWGDLGYDGDALQTPLYKVDLSWDGSSYTVTVEAKQGYYLSEIKFLMYYADNAFAHWHYSGEYYSKNIDSLKLNKCTITLGPDTISNKQCMNEIALTFGLARCTSKERYNRFSDFQVTVKPYTYSINYTLKNEITDADIGTPTTIYYAPTLSGAGSGQSVSTTVGSKSQTFNVGSLYYGLCGSGALSAAQYESYVYKSASHYKDIVYNSIELRYYINGTDTILSRNFTSEPTGYDSAYMTDSGVKYINNNLFNSNSNNKTLTAVMYKTPEKYTVTVELGKVSYGTNENYVWFEKSTNNWIELTYGKDYSVKSDGYGYFTFDMYYGETYIQAMNRYFKDRNSKSSTKTAFTEFMATTTKFPSFATTEQISTGNLKNVSTNSTIYTTSTITANTTITPIYSNRTFTLRYNKNLTEYGLQNAYAITDTNGSTTWPNNITVTVNSNVNNVANVYGCKMSSSTITEVRKLKGWYLNSDKDLSNIESYKLFIPGCSQKLEARLSNGCWVDENFDGYIDVYAHYYDADETEFLYNLTFKGITTQEQLAQYMDVGTFDFSSGFTIETNSNNGYLKITFYVKQFEDLIINFETYRNYFVTDFDGNYYNCNKRGSGNIQTISFDYNNTWNSYLNTLNPSVTVENRTFGGSTSTITNNYINVDLSDGYKYHITINNTIGCISTSSLYYGGDIEIEFEEKNYWGDVGVGTVSDTDTYSLSIIAMPNTFASDYDFKDKYYFKKYNII